MENEEKNREYQRKKYIKKVFRKFGFLNDEYEKLEIDEFIDTLIEIKEGDEILVGSGSKEKNHFLFESIMNGENQEKLISKLIEKKSLNTNILQYKNLNPNNYIQFPRDIIKSIKTSYRDTDYLKPFIGYEKKIILLINYINQIIEQTILSSKDIVRLDEKDLYNSINFPLEIKTILINTKKELDKEDTLLYSHFETIVTMLYHDAIVQLIVYDFLYYNMPEKIKNDNFKKLKKFFEKFEQSLEKQLINKTKKQKAHRKNKIYEDFISYITLNSDLLSEKKFLNIQKKIPKFESKLKPLDKELNFLFSFENIKKQFPDNYKEMHILCHDFLDLKIVKENLNPNTGILLGKDCEEYYKKHNIKFEETINTFNAKQLYGAEKFQRSMSKELENIERVLEKFQQFNKVNLEVKKVIVSFISNDKTVIKPYRKSLKNIIKDAENLKDPEIITRIRCLITRGMYLEKNSLKEYEKNIELQILILNILSKINTIKSSSKRKLIKNLFFKEVLKYYIELKKDDPIIYIHPKYLN